ERPRLCAIPFFGESRTMLKCERARELISARIDREVIFEEQVLEDHLQTCAECRAELDGTRRLDDLLWQSFARERESAEVLVDRGVASLHERGRPVHKATVLLVDDQMQILMPWRGLLADEFDVLIAGSAAEAQALFGKQKIDIILTDQRMPDMT